MFKLLKLKKKMYNKKMDITSSSQPKTMTKEEIFFHDVNSFLDEVKKNYGVIFESSDLPSFGE